MKKHLWLLAFILLSFNAFSQITFFNVDTVKFINDFEKYIGEAANSKLNDDAAKFIKSWNKNLITTPQKRLLVKICNTMIMSGKTQEDFFWPYIQIVNYFLVNPAEETGLDTWQGYYLQTLENDPEKLPNFLNFSLNFFTRRTLFANDRHEWTTNAENYDLQFKRYPILKLKNIDITCTVTDADTIFIRNTSGTYLPYKNEWVGKKGRIDWRRTGLDTNKVYVHLNNYNLNTSRSDFKADSVIYKNSYFFSQVLLGGFEDKGNVTQGAGTFFPKFNSYEKTLFIKNIFPGVDLTGGFIHQGQGIKSNGNDSVRAKIDIYYKNKLTGRAYAKKEFVIKPAGIITDNAMISLYMRDSATDKLDSVFHLSAGCNFSEKTRELSITRSDKGFGLTPFKDSYHRMEITCDAIFWTIDLPFYAFSMINPSGTAKFESGNYFRDQRYDAMQGILEYNPIERMRTFVLKRKKDGYPTPQIFTPAEFAQFLNNKTEYVTGLLILMNDKGFILYDTEKDLVTVLPKTSEYFLAHEKISDFDVIGMQSVISAKPNGVINLVNNDLVLEGVKGLQFSDSQSVYVVPTSQQFTVRKNRNMYFGGRMHAGRFDFYGKNFYFDYNNFLIKLDNVDSMRFVCPSRENPEKYVLVKTVLQNIYGTLYIDKENNKSGLKDYPEYPMFVSDRGAMVYYDKPEIFGGVYNREEFYFKTDPFTIRSLDNFKLEDIKLSGLFSSGGIVPDFNDTLTVQKDYSLGFIRQNPPEGFAMYGGKGKNFGQVSLSNEGFIGTGKIEYLTSVGYSARYFMFLDSTNGMFEEYNIARTATVPDVKGTDVYMHWKAKEDQMDVSNRETPLDIFKGKANMFGTVTLSPVSLEGRGRLEFDKAVLASEVFDFHPITVNAATSDFKIKGDDTTRIAFLSNNVNSFVDFEKRYGDFKSNNEGANTFFPINDYRTNLNDFKWEIDQRKITLSKPVGTDDPHFVSTKNGQDSLKFTAGRASFTMSNNILDINEVPFINVCDGKIYPDKQNVVVESEAYMRPLLNSKLTCDSVSEYHKLYDCEIQIRGKYKMEGGGFYDYVDSKGHKQVIHFEKITDNQRGRIVGTCPINDRDSFLVGPKFGFKGNINLLSNALFLEFDGFVRPIHEMWTLKTEPYQFTKRINPDSVILSFSHPKNQYKADLFTGLAYNADSPHVYAGFSCRKRYFGDNEILRGHGVLYYDEPYQQFVITDSARYLKKSLRGSYMLFKEATNEVYGEGKFNFNFKMSDIKIEAAGNCNVAMGDTITVNFETMLLMDFPFPKSALNNMFDNFEADNERAKNVRYNSEFSKKCAAEFLDDKTLEKWLKKYTEDEKFLVANAFEKALVFGNLKLEWHSKSKRYIYDGEAGLTAINKKALNKFVKIKISIEKKKQGDIMNMYLLTNKGTWYYFFFSKGTLGGLSSEAKFNEIIIKEGPKVKAPDIRIRESTEKQKNNFLRDFPGW
ncbi:MAG: hypothetical protein SGJ10_13940 [Bacteroidota bacterium]|nr:hypothetical protein [Bacteroidota bacterium]